MIRSKISKLWESNAMCCDSHLLHEVCRVEPGHDAVVPGGGQELVEGDGLATEVVLQAKERYLHRDDGQSRKKLSWSSVTCHDCRAVVDSSPLKNTIACGGRGRGSFSSLGE